MGGAELVGCSTATAKRYIQKLTSLYGPLEEASDKLKGRILFFKDNLNPELNPELASNKNDRRKYGKKD